MKFNEREYKPYKEFQDKNVNWVYLWSDEDSNEVATVVDAESTTGECGCPDCIES